MDPDDPSSFGALPAASHRPRTQSAAPATVNATAAAGRAKSALATARRSPNEQKFPALTRAAARPTSHSYSTAYVTVSSGTGI